MSDKSKTAKWQPITILNPSTRYQMSLAAAAAASPRIKEQQRNHIYPRESHIRQSSMPPQFKKTNQSIDGESHYEVIDFSTNNKLNTTSSHHSTSSRCSNSSQQIYREKKLNDNIQICALCGSQNLFSNCHACNQKYCKSCDSMNHMHPKRRDHIRQRIINQDELFDVKRFERSSTSMQRLPPLPPKNDGQNQPPLPPPRRRRTFRQNERMASYNDNSSLGMNFENLKLKPHQYQRPLSMQKDFIDNSIIIQSASSIKPNETSMDKLSTLQDRYRKYQNTMRTQSVNRRKVITPELPQRNNNYPNDSLKMMRNSFQQPPLPMKGNMQSYSVCDLSTKHRQNPHSHQGSSSSSYKHSYDHGDSRNGRSVSSWNNYANDSTLSLNNVGLCYQNVNQHSPMTIYNSGTSSSCESINKCQQWNRSINSLQDRRPKRSTKSQSRSYYQNDSTYNTSFEETDDDSGFNNVENLQKNHHNHHHQQKYYPRGGNSSRPTPPRKQNRKWMSEAQINKMPVERDDDYGETDQWSCVSYNQSKKCRDKKMSKHMSPCSSRHKNEKYHSRRDSYVTEDDCSYSECESHSSRCVRSRQSTKTNDGYKESLRSSDISPRLEKKNTNYNRSGDGGENNFKRGSIDLPRDNKTHMRNRSKSFSCNADNGDIKYSNLKTSGIEELRNSSRELRLTQQRGSTNMIQQVELNSPIIQKINNEKKWNCEHCTFLNEEKNKICIMCCKTKKSALPKINSLDDLTIDKCKIQADNNSDCSESSNSRQSMDSISTKSRGLKKQEASFEKSIEQKIIETNKLIEILRREDDIEKSIETNQQIETLKQEEDIEKSIETNKLIEISLQEEDTEKSIEEQIIETNQQHETSLQEDDIEKSIETNEQIEPSLQEEDIETLLQEEDIEQSIETITIETSLLEEIDKLIEEKIIKTNQEFEPSMQEDDVEESSEYKIKETIEQVQTLIPEDIEKKITEASKLPIETSMLTENIEETIEEKNFDTKQQFQTSIVEATIENLVEKQNVETKKELKISIEEKKIVEPIGKKVVETNQQPETSILREDIVESIDKKIIETNQQPETSIQEENIKELLIEIKHVKPNEQLSTSIQNDIESLIEEKKITQTNKQIKTSLLEEDIENKIIIDKSKLQILTSIPINSNQEKTLEKKVSINPPQVEKTLIFDQGIVLDRQDIEIQSVKMMEKDDHHLSSIVQDVEPTITTLQNILPIEKQKNQIKPFLSRIWSLPDGIENKQEDTLDEKSNVKQTKNIIKDITNKQRQPIIHQKLIDSHYVLESQINELTNEKFSSGKTLIFNNHNENFHSQKLLSHQQQVMGIKNILSTVQFTDLYKLKIMDIFKKYEKQPLVIIKQQQPMLISLNLSNLSRGYSPKISTIIDEFNDHSAFEKIEENQTLLPQKMHNNNLLKTEKLNLQNTLDLQNYKSNNLLKIESSEKNEISQKLDENKHEITSELISIEFNTDEELNAAQEYYRAESISLLKQYCEICAGYFVASQMVSMFKCTHHCCNDCAKNYFTIQVTEKIITDVVCPFCKEPDLTDANEDDILEYFSILDIQLKSFLDPPIHELFQRKLRDRTLMQDPNFKWCAQCSSGYYVTPNQQQLVCPDCRSVTCALCHKLWEKQHENSTCEEFAEWKEENDPDKQAAGLAKHLAENGINCPKCNFWYSLSRGGCMHFTCNQCKFEFCCSCGEAFMLGAKCSVGPYCSKLGLHAHHPRNCLFYLRDKEPELLQELLKNNGIEYKIENLTDDYKCQVQLQKETANGVIDTVCNSDVVINYAGLCRQHYIEYLASIIQDAKLDPIEIFDINEVKQELRRRGKVLPCISNEMSDQDYLKFCIKVVQQEIPLQ